jgi:chromosome segregation ATPase
MEKVVTPEKKATTPAKTKSDTKISPGPGVSPGSTMGRGATSERVDPKILDSRLRSLIENAKDKLQRVTGDVAGLRKELSDLQAALNLSNEQKDELLRKEEELKKSLQEKKDENDGLLARKNELEQKVAKAKDELQGLVKTHNQTIKAYSMKVSQLGLKERQDLLKREETKAALKQQINQGRRDNEELRTNITDLTKKIEGLRAVLQHSQEIEQRRLEALSKDAQDLEHLLGNI